MSSLPTQLEDFSPQDTIVFSVDINNGFCREGALYSPRTESLIEPTASFLQDALQRGIPVCAFSDTHPETSFEFQGYPVHCLQGDRESLLVDELSFLYQNPNATVLEKNSTNGFFVLTPELLKGKQNLIVTGCCTDICVYQLAVSLKTYYNQENTFANVYAIKDLIDTYDAPGHNAQEWNHIFFASMAMNGIIVLENFSL